MSDNITDQQILQGLLKRERDLLESTAQAKKIIAANEKAMIAVKNAITAFKGINVSNDPHSTAGKVSLQKLNIPAAYSKNLILKEKIAFILKERGPSLVDEVVSSMFQKEPDLDLKRTKIAVTTLFSTNKEYFTFTKEGIKYRWALK